MSSDKIVLEVQERDVTGKKVAALRREELVPAVIYGADYEPTNIQVPYLAIERVARKAGTHIPIEIDLDGKKQTAIIKSIDMDPVKNQISHVSFQAISADQVVTAEVPIEVIELEESEAGKAGFTVMQAMEEVEIKAKPADLPEKVTVSARDMKEHGDKLTISDIVLPSGVELADEGDKELAVATIIDPAIEAAKQEAAEKAAAEAEAAAAPVETEATEGEAPAEGEDAPADEKPAE